MGKRIYPIVRANQGQYGDHTMRSLNVRCTKNSLLTVQRSSRWKKRMVYILVANKSYKYDSGERSHIIYIGTTGKGAHRPATSAVDKASEAFKDLRGVKEIKVHIATCRGRRAMRTWEHLESALQTRLSDTFIGNCPNTTSGKAHLSAWAIFV